MGRLSRAITFEKLHNVRDLGGMNTEDGRTIKEGCFIRSGHLEDLSVSDRKKLQDIVSLIIDFRTEEERNEKPDSVIDGISYIHIPILDTLTPGITREAEAEEKIFAALKMEPDEAKQYMCDMYTAFAGDNATVHYAEFVRIILEKHEKAVLWHCTAGKDRAGIGAAIVEEILGVPRDDIIEDYLSTNRHLENEIAFLTDFIKKKTGTDSKPADEALGYLFGADKDYIMSYYKAVYEKYGSFDRYIKEGIGLAPQDVEAIRECYLRRG